MSAKENDMSARFGFLRDFAIGALLIGGAIFILALPSVQNFLAAASAAGDGALATAGAIGASVGSVSPPGCSSFHWRWPYTPRRRNTLATMPRWNRGRCSSPARTRKTSCSMTPIG
jgi:hypothetical protein